ncbi:MAG: sulfatase-like hydrolase/transferase [Betaproteobacteria bacterium]|nr:sulfatase-like hydrolase/transferase [Betaproteobacteria bacterium]
MTTRNPTSCWCSRTSRACSVGYAGEEPVITPHLDRLAGQSAVLTTAVSPTPVCTPYRGSLITGRTALSLGLVLNDIPLATTETSLAHAVTRAGYDTGYIGKWHLNGGDRPAWVPPGPPRQGFDFWAAANFDHNYDRSAYFTGDSPEPRTWPGHDAESQTTLAIDYMTRHRASEKPFCLVLSWGPPHHPYRTVAKNYLDLYDPDAIPLAPIAPTRRARISGATTPRPPSSTTRWPGSWPRSMRSGLLTTPSSPFTSDHGDMHGSHGVYKKQMAVGRIDQGPVPAALPGNSRGRHAIRFPR